MHKDEFGNIIGRGEETVLTILKELYPNEDIRTQYPYKFLLKVNWQGTVTERQEKERLDLVVFRGKPAQPIVIRVQDPHHSGKITAERDTVQRKTLEWNNCVVIDVQHYNCPSVFSENLSDESRREVLEAFKDEGITF